MIEGVGFLLSLGILAAVTLIIGLVFVGLRLPIVTAEILAGMLVGPYVLGWVADTSVIGEIASAGIVVLLFLIGLELDPVEFLKVMRRVGFLALLEVGLTFGVGLLCAYLLRMDPTETIIFSVAVSMTSTAIVGQMVLGRGVMRDTSRILMGLLVVEDTAAVVLLIVISSLPAGGASLASIGLPSILETFLGGLALLALGFLVARYLAPPTIDYLSHYEGEFEELPFLFSLGLGFGFGILGSYLGYSPGIGAFIIGLAMRGKHSKFLSGKVYPVKGLLVFVFFVYMGTLIDPFPAIADLSSLFLVIMLLVAAKFLGGVVVGQVMRRGMGLEELEPETIGAWLVPRGEFSFIIGQTALAAGLIDSSIFSALGFTVLATAIAGPLLQRVTERRPAPSQHPFKADKDE